MGRKFLGGVASDNVLQALQQALRTICNPQDVDAQAFADQADMIESYGGKSKAARLGAPSSTPPPSLESG